MEEQRRAIRPWVIESLAPTKNTSAPSNSASVERLAIAYLPLSLRYLMLWNASYTDVRFQALS